MVDLYVKPSISGYNSSPPPDDDSKTAANAIKWSTIKTKLPDPIKSLVDSMNTLIDAGFDAMFGNAVRADSSGGAMTTSDYGKLIKTTNAITVTLPTATDAGGNFCFAVYNADASASLVLGRNGASINGVASDLTFAFGAGGIVFCDGTNWWVLKTINATGVLYSNTTATLTVGYTLTTYDNGTKSSGTLTVNPALGSMQKYVNGGAHTLAPPTTVGAIVMTITNNASAATS